MRGRLRTAEQQNEAECHYKHVKEHFNTILNTSGAPANCWLPCLKYVCFIFNQMAMESLYWHTPHECLTGSTPDISMIYQFQFYDKVYVK